MKRILAGALAALMGLAAPASATPFKDDVIYLVMVDRFANGDQANDHGADPKNPHAYHGGDLVGLKNKLDYLHELGVTTLWLTPVNDNQDNAYLGKYWGYHGYWIQDFKAVDEHLGTDADLQALVAAAHQRGMKVLVDVVVNHCGYDAPIAKQQPGFFHHNGSITDWEDPYQCENYDLVGLPDFASENKAVLAFMEDAWGTWVTRDHVDGFRLDTVRHVPMAFMHHFLGTMHALAKGPFYTVGEVSFHDPHRVAPYLDGAGLDASFDFPMFETLGQVFAKGGRMTLLADRLAQDKLYSDPSHLAPFLDSHDEVRFLTAAGGDEKKLRLALACLLTLRGTPCLTWGTEVGITGGADPDNRHDMPWPKALPPLWHYTSQLVHLRRATPALAHGTQRTLAVGDHAIAYERAAGSQRAIVALNNGAVATTLTVPGAGAWRDLLGGAGATASHGKLTLQVPAMGAVVLVPGG